MRIHSIEVEEGYPLTVNEPVHVDNGDDLWGDFQVSFISIYPANNRDGVEIRVEVAVPIIKNGIDTGDYNYYEVGYESCEW